MSIQKHLINHIHQDDSYQIEEELKSLKTLQNLNDDEANKRRKEVLNKARQERLQVSREKRSIIY